MAPVQAEITGGRATGVNLMKGLMTAGGMRRVLGTYVGPRASLDRIFQIGSYLDVGRCQKHMVRPPCGDCHPGVI